MLQTLKLIESLMVKTVGFFNVSLSGVHLLFTLLYQLSELSFMNQYICSKRYAVELLSLLTVN